MSKLKKVLIMDGEKPVWKFGTYDVSATEITTGVVMGSVRCAPGHTVLVDDKPAGTITTVGRLGPTGRWVIGIKPPSKPRAKKKKPEPTVTLMPSEAEADKE